MRGLTITLGLLAACYSPAPSPGAPCSPEGGCPSGLVCIAGVCQREDAPAPDGSKLIDACAAAPRCDGNDLVTCADRVTCENGCGGAEPHCLQLAPSNGLTRDLVVGVTNDFGLDKMDFDTATGRMRVMGTDFRPEGTGVINGIRFEVVDGIGVFAAKSWTLAAGESWSISGANPIALFAAESITIAGTLDVGGSLGSGGPGGTGSNTTTAASGCRGRAGRSLDATHGEGGGGGGGATVGGNGGTAGTAGATGLGGPPCTTGATTIPLRGGAGGGEGGDSSSNAGGGGGGAIALVALESITITGTVGAPGAGGVSLSTGNGGGGGGGGGAVLVEAPVVSITGALTANGGGGGAPSGGANGARGSLTTASAALGGNYAGSGGPARGGNGGAGTTPPTIGASYTYTDPATTVVTVRGGGGGGAVGRIEVKRRVGGVAGLASPPASVTDAAFD